MRTFALLLSLAVASLTFADGTITTPENIAPTTWKIAGVYMTTGSGGDVPVVTIVIHYFASGSTSPDAVTAINLTGAEIASFATTIIAPVAGESGSSAKKYRQRVTAWLLANNKITNVTPE